jgi:hypothetical protein
MKEQAHFTPLARLHDVRAQRVAAERAENDVAELPVIDLYRALIPGFGSSASSTAEWGISVEA